MDHLVRRRRLLVFGVIALVGTPRLAHGADVFALEETTLQSRLDEAWAYSVESRARRGGIVEKQDTSMAEKYAIFAMTWFNEFGPEYDGLHLAAGMLNFEDRDVLAFGHGPNFGFSRFASNRSQRWPFLSGLKLQDAEATATRLFAGWSLGFQQAFVELGYRWLWWRTDPTLLAGLETDESEVYAGAHRADSQHGPYAKLRVGYRAVGLRAFVAQGRSLGELRQAYIEPTYRFESESREWALGTTAGFKVLDTEGSGRLARLLWREELQWGRERNVDESSGKAYFDRNQVVFQIDNVWAPDAMSASESLGDVSHYTYRVETEPFYVGTWYNEVLGFGWGVGLAGTSEWEENGQTMRVMLRYLRNDISPEPVPERLTPWLVQFTVAVGW